mmetsp:Transcript_53991/g.85939  ORF Transcript_53991/g.85939 Transcript_53991/m.85939 type:complete len:214 (+) Transcript_53991:369-1010(+)
MPAVGRNSGFVGSISKSPVAKTPAIRGSFTSTLKLLSCVLSLAALFAAVRCRPRTLKPLSSSSSPSANSSRSPAAASPSSAASSFSSPAPPSLLFCRSSLALSFRSFRFSLRLSKYCCHVLLGFASASLRMRDPLAIFCSSSTRSASSSPNFSVERLKVASMLPSTSFPSSSSSLCLKKSSSEPSSDPAIPRANFFNSAAPALSSSSPEEDAK